MEKKLHVGVLFGGRSCEHEVSVTSARSVLEAIDKNKYNVTMIGISKEGRWLVVSDAAKVFDQGVVEAGDLQPVTLGHIGKGQLIVQDDSDSRSSSHVPVDVIFPILHGPYGEDGTVQGLLELAGVAYVGSGVLGSAVAMDKDMMKRVFRAEGLPQLDYATIRRQRWQREPEAVGREIEERFRYPVFVKPANLGSSVGVSKVHDMQQLQKGIAEAAAFDGKIIVEAEAAECREVECAVLGNDNPQASVLGEIVPGSEFYDYKAKYLEDTSELIIPAGVSKKATQRIQAIALQAFRAVDAAGLARVDFFVRKDSERVYLNEINTMPGFTPISMYPRLWEASGIPYSELIDRLLQLALQRHTEEQATQKVL